jgi:hypothetical protein
MAAEMPTEDPPGDVPPTASTRTRRIGYDYLRSLAITDEQLQTWSASGALGPSRDGVPGDKRRWEALRPKVSRTHARSDSVAPQEAFHVAA